MHYAQIRNMDISNGTGIGSSIFVQGCDNKCNGCFNQETWDFNGGEEFTEENRHEFVNMVKRLRRKRVSILGGEPLDLKNVRDVLDLVLELKENIEGIEIWVFTGYTLNFLIEKFIENPAKYIYVASVINSIDVLVDGPFILDLKDFQLKFRGSSNQRIIDLRDCKEDIFDYIKEYNSSRIDNIVNKHLLSI